MNKRIFNKDGITLTVLVVTIIVMLILVGVTMSVINNTGILKNAEGATQNYQIAEEETINVAFATILAKSTLKDKEITLEEFLEELEKAGLDVTVKQDPDDENKFNIRVEGTENEYTIDKDTGKLEHDGTYSEESEENLAGAKIVMTATPTVPTNGNVVVSINSGSGTNTSKLALEYRIGNSGQWKEYKSPLTITTNLVVWARFRYINEVTEYSSLTITNIDKLIPVVTAVTTTTNKITFSANDPAKTTDYNCSQINAYAVTTSNTAPALNATGGTEGNAGLGKWISCSKTTTISNKTLTGYTQGTKYYVWVRDTAGNVSEGTTSTNQQTDLITGNITFGNVEWNSTTANRAKVTVNVNSLQSGCSLQYKIGTGGTWTTIASGNYIPEQPSGTVIYARIFDGTNEGPTGTASTTASSYASVTIRDNTPPTIALGTNSNATWSQNASVTVTITDNQSMIPTGQTVKYGWSTSNSTAPTAYHTQTLSNTSATRSTSFNAVAPTTEQASLSGRYYLWVVPVNLKDAAANAQTGTKKTTGTFSIDNVKPVVTAVTTTTNKITFSATDAIGITAYAVTKNNTAPALSATGGSQGNAGLGKWISCTSTTQITNQTLTGYTQGTTYYVWTRDAAGNVSVSQNKGTNLITGNITFGSAVWNGSKAKVTVSVNSLQPGCSLQYRIGTSGTWTTIASGSYIPEQANRTVVYARIYDGTNEGPSGSASTTVSSYASTTIIDNTAPTKPTVTIASNGATGFTVRVSSTDTGSGIKHYTIYYKLPKAIGTAGDSYAQTTITTTSKSLTCSFAGTGYAYATATDNVGNTSAAATAVSATNTKYSYSVAYGTGTLAGSGGTGNGSYFYNQTITLRANVSAGYTWSKWTSSNTGLKGDIGTQNATFTMPTGTIKMTATTTANTNTRYVVQHYQMALNGTYPTTPTETQNLTGTTGTKAASSAKSYTGFTEDSTKRVNVGANIAGNGSLVIKYYYKRNQYTISYAAGGGTGTMASDKVYYGAQYTIKNCAFTKTGYTFLTWMYNRTGQLELLLEQLLQ